jgi:hypothetical protein
MVFGLLLEVHERGQETKRRVLFFNPWLKCWVNYVLLSRLGGEERHLLVLSQTRDIYFVTRN